MEELPALQVQPDQMELQALKVFPDQPARKVIPAHRVFRAYKG